MNSKFKEYAIYQIYPKSFQDTNSDGFGDLEGVIKRLPLLAKLGIDMIWLSPFYKSHQYDNGYDVDDYKSIDPRYGDFEIFDRLVAEAKKYNIGIMLDMVFNHTSIHHEWFQEALKGNKKYQDYYIWKDKEEITNWDSKFGGSAWEYCEELDKYYLHLYHPNQADLNWKNPEVRNEFSDVLRFWMDKGVKGFRFDVINVTTKPDVYEDDHIGDGRRFYTDGPQLMDWLHEIFTKAGFDESIVTVAELSSTSIENSNKYTNPKNGVFSMAFNFHHLKVDYIDGNKWTVTDMKWNDFFTLIDEWQRKAEEQDGWSAWFLNNHDQPRAVSRFGNPEKYHYESATALATLTHLMRGTPYIYQGEEIGMTNPNYESIDDYDDYESTNYYKILLENGRSEEDALKAINFKSRDNSRAPVRWDDSEYGGFSDAKPWIGVNKDKKINYMDAVNDKHSVFYHYQDLIRLRKDHKAIAYGSYKSLYFDDKVYIFERAYEDEKLIVLINVSEENHELDDPIKETIKNGKIISNNYKDFDFSKLAPYQAVVVSI